MSLKATILPERGVLRVGGAEARTFLQNLITNNVDLVGKARPIYAALLTPQGKFLFDFFVVEDPESDALLLDCDRARLGDLTKRLNFYKLRAQVTIEDVSEDRPVVAMWNTESGDPMLPTGAFIDPRLPVLGWRVIAAAPSKPLEGETAATPADYHRHRIAHGVGDAHFDFEPDRTFPLEVNFEELNGVDFQKGCFIGQEVTSRTKRRGTVRKRLLPCTVEGDVPKPHTPVRAVGREVGTVFSVDREGGRVLALLRLDLLNGAPLEVDFSTLTPHKPAWAHFELEGGVEDEEGEEA